MKSKSAKWESSAHDWIGKLIAERRSLMKNRKRVGKRTEPCGTPLLIGIAEEK